MRQLVDPKTFGRPIISLALFGCTNRPFYHISVFPDKSLGRKYEGNVIEQLGVFDPLPNERNEKLVSLNIHRIKYWIGERNAHVTVSALELFGLSGLLPLHPRTFVRAEQQRQLIQYLRDKYKSIPAKPEVTVTGDGATTVEGSEREQTVAAASN